MKNNLTFRVYPDGKSELFYRVNVWKNIKAMQKHCSPWIKLEDNVQGVCSSWTSWLYEKGKEKKSYELGEINFVNKHLNMEVISHEAAHAALGFCRRKRIDVTQHRVHGKKAPMKIVDGEEQFCYALGWIVASICYGLKLVGRKVK